MSGAFPDLATTYHIPQEGIEEMKTLPTCLCIFGLAAVAQGGSVLMDQIGANDGSSIGTTLSANQIFEADFAAYDVVTIDDFDNASGSSASQISLVMGGWNGFAGLDAVQGVSANFYESPEAAANSLVGYANAEIPGSPAADPDWAGAAGTFLIHADVAMNVNAGMAYVGLIPINEYGTNGQTGSSDSVLGEGGGWQANPGDGFGFGGLQATAASVALRVLGGGPSDPCATALRDAPCNADVDFNNIVNVEDLLLVISTFGEEGDGSARPAGDCAPLPNGDCVVNVEDILAVIAGFNADCTPVDPTGGCCMDNGDCDTYTEAACEGMGGSYLGDDSDCSSCIHGACCYNDGSCMETLDSNCDGTFVGGSCADAGCQAVEEVCCVSSTECLEVDQATCDAFGGTMVQGACADSPCGLSNDTCDSAANAAIGETAFDTTDATDSGFGEPDDTQCSGTYLDWTGSPDVWFKHTAGTDGLMTISLCDANSYDTSLVLYEGDDCASLVQVACNGDSTVETGCQSYYSGIYDHAVTGGNTYYIRIGGWQGDTGPGTMMLDLVGSDTQGACCVAGDCIGQNTNDECAALGGLWNNGLECSEVDCPQPYVAGGCDEDENGEGACNCFIDGDDSETDCNGGGNLVTPTYGVLTVGSSICGVASVFVDGPTGGTYRDLDWYHSAGVNAGGTFTVTIGSNFSDVCLFLNEDAGTVDYATQNVGGYFDTTVLEIPAGNWAVIASVSEWDTSVTCGSGLDTYSLTVE